jgi:hypothetical protein
VRSVLYDVYEQLPPGKVLKFFTRDETNWHEYLQRSDAFTLEAFAQLQERQRATLKQLRSEP